MKAFPAARGCRLRRRPSVEALFKTVVYITCRAVPTVDTPRPADRLDFSKITRKFRRFDAFLCMNSQRERLRGCSGTGLWRSSSRAWVSPAFLSVDEALHSSPCPPMEVTSLPNLWPSSGPVHQSTVAAQSKTFRAERNSRGRGTGLAEFIGVDPHSAVGGPNEERAR